MPGSDGSLDALVSRDGAAGVVVECSVDVP